MATRFHSASAMAAYRDLLRLLKDDAIADLRGKPVPKEVSGKTYWYDRYRQGSQVIDRYIGEDSAELTERFARAAALAEGRKASEQERTRLVRLLRAEGMLTADVASGQITTALARAGVFRLGGTFVGTQAFRLYEGLLGLSISADQAATTRDIDIASFERLSLALGDTVDPAFADVFSQFDFAPIPSLRPNSVWRWQQTNRETMVEFLTPSFSDEEDLRDLPALGVQAQAQHHLNFLIADPVEAVVLYRSGCLVRIPRPECFAIHKLIVADRRRTGSEPGQARKDRMQAALLIGVLAEEDPDLLRDAYTDARERGPVWRQRLDATLEKMPDEKRRLDGLVTDG